jgi:hypothetical protein
MTRATAARKTKAAAPATLTLPDLAKGEAHGGLLFKDGKPSHFVIVRPGDTSGTWGHCMKWAKEQGGELPTRKEQALLFANAAEHFKTTWYWSGEQYASDAEFAWGQDFYDGDQGGWLKSYEYRARAVRRVPI